MPPLTRFATDNADEGMFDENQDAEVDEKGTVKTEVPSSNASEDSRSSFNDRKSKDSNTDSPESSSGKMTKSNQDASINGSLKRSHDYDTSVESDRSEGDEDYVKSQHKQRRPKTRKLDSNPLYWTTDDVFRYLRKTSDCKDLAYRVKQEVRKATL